MNQNTPEGSEARMPEQNPPSSDTPNLAFDVKVDGPLDVSKLLRLKRYEQPGDHYFEGFIVEFHRRQRADMVRISPLRLWFERMQASLDGVAVGKWAYGGAVAVFAVTVTAVSLNGPAGALRQAPGGEVAQRTAPAASPVISIGSGTSRYADNGVFNFGGTPVRPSYDFSVMQRGQMQGGAQAVSAAQVSPVYVLDARPVSYEPPFSF